MLTFSVYGVEVIGDKARNLPIVSTEDKDKALEAFKSQIKAAFDTLNAEMMRFVGGDVSIHCEKCPSPLGDATDIIAFARIKRPIHSPKAEVFYGE